jgi:hypothetical protein
MSKKFGFKLIFIVLIIVGPHVATIAAAGIAYGNELAPSQLVTPADLTAVELDFYNKATDPAVKKNFLVTRSYLRIAQKVVDKKLPASAFPVIKPTGFSVQYLLPDDPHVINEAMGLALSKSLQKCLDNKAPECR